MEEVTNLVSCRMCESDKLRKVLDFGNVPLANNLPAPYEFPPFGYPLSLNACQDCMNVQLSVAVDPSILFKNYLFVSGTTETLRNHHKDLANLLVRDYDLKDKCVLDIGANDGDLLSYFKAAGTRYSVGVDPAVNLLDVSSEKADFIVPDFWCVGAWQRIVDRYRNGGEEISRPSLITALNVFAHVLNIRKFVSDVSDVLLPDGLFVIEFPYLINTVDGMQWDSIYHEHLSYLLLNPVALLLHEFGLQIEKAYVVDIYGGSLRIIARKKIEEDKSTIFSMDTWFTEKTWFRDGDVIVEMKGKIDDQCKRLHDICKGKYVVGYGAPAKASTLLNVFKWQLEYVVDDNPLKQGRYIPGMYIPIHKPSYFIEDKRIDYMLILAWNYSDEIIQKVRMVRPDMKFIILPEVKII